MYKILRVAALAAVALALLSVQTSYADTVSGTPTATAQTARITGMINCTEYGTPYKDSPQLILEGTTNKYYTQISSTDGTFYIEAPCGASYKLRVKFCSRSFGFGTMEVPACTPEGLDLLLQVHYPGSMLEMVHWAESGRGVEGITFELSNPSAPSAPAPVMTNTTTTKGE